MIGIFEALDWLNAIDGNSCLTDTERGLSMAARVVSNSEDDVRRIHNRLRNLGQRSRDPEETAEVALHIAAIEYWREWFFDAVQNTRQAVSTYRSDNHRRAVAQWISGMAQWRVSQNDDAFTSWREARRTFQDRQSELRNSPNLRAWYEAWTWQMDLELTAKPEEIYTWLNWFADDATSLSLSSGQLVRSIVDNIRRLRYSEVYPLIRDIQQINRWSTVIYERAEVFFECGLAAYQIGNLDLAIELLQRAMLDFAPGIGNNHKQVVARCMLGAVEWLKPDNRNQASTGWRRCIEEFRELMLRADQRNDQQTRQWYADRIALLEAALSERLPGGTPQGRKPRSPNPAPPDDGSSPSTPPPNGQKIDPYQDLLSMVGGDAATAERLIAFEQRYAPNARRDELIKRAIERLKRDRQ
jgi:tetratricopeptide (TPR) repeat protein